MRPARVACISVLALCAATVRAFSIMATGAEEHQPLAPTVSGFALHSVYSHTADGSIKRHIVPDNHRRLAEAEIAEEEAAEAAEAAGGAEAPPFAQHMFSTTRESVLAFTQMMLMSYPHWWETTQTYAMYAVPGQTFPEMGSTAASNTRYRTAAYDEAKAALGRERFAPAEDVFLGARAANDRSSQLGVNVFVYKRGNATVLYFRGSWSDMDTYDNMFLLKDWLLQKAQATNLKRWAALGLEVTPAMKERTHPGFLDAAAARIYKDTLRATSAFGAQILGSDIAALGAATGVDPKKIERQGYWPVYKAVVRDVLATQRAAGQLTQSEVYLVGHSKGATAASLVSMWLKKEDGVSYPALAMSPFGSQCFARALYSHDMNTR